MKKKAAKRVTKKKAAKRDSTALSKLRDQLTEGTRKKLFAALIARANEHGKFKPEAGFTFSNGAQENAARLMECVDIAYEIGNDEERAAIAQMRKERA